MRAFPKVCLTPRSVLVFMLLAAMATFSIQAIVSYHAYDMAEQDQKAAETRLMAQQRTLEQRLAAVESSEQRQKTDIENRIQAISARQDQMGTTAHTVATKAPFPIDSVMPSIVELVCLDNADKNTYYSGSGTVISKDGLIMTNRHLLISTDGSLIRYCGVGFTTDAEQPPKIEYVARVDGLHDGTDLALLRIIERLDGKALPKEFPALTVDAGGAGKNIGIGDPIYIAGYPGIGAETFTFTEGVVSGRVGTDLIKTSALIDSGTSGGAAFDGNGVYIGVATAAARGDIGGSLGYLIDTDTVNTFLSSYFAGTDAVPPAAGPAKVQVPQPATQ